MDDNQRACLGFSLCGGLGPATFGKLVSHFTSPHEAFMASPPQLRPFFRTQKSYEVFIEFRKGYSFANVMKRLEELDVWVMTQWCNDYPKLLKDIQDPPICLFGKGDRNSIDLNGSISVGIVGARKHTAYGGYVAEELGKAFAAAGMVIVSGMASGIDTLSHKAAIANKAQTVAVLGTAIDVIYPRENVELHNQILNEFGIIISEYPPGFITSPGMFVLRNRIIVGLSRAIVVVEGGKHSGTLTTARYAAENGRDVYAVPGPITSEMSVGPHILLREGAHLLSNAQELLADFGLSSFSHDLPMKSSDLVGEERTVYDLLSMGKFFADDVAKRISRSISETLPLLSLLEVRGVITKEMDGGFIAKV